MMSRLRGSSRSGSRLRALSGCLALALVAAPLMGCSFFKDKSGDYVPDDPPDMLYNEGLFLLNNKGDYKAAAKKFDEVDRQDPYSDWARKSLLMSAYAYYQARAIRRVRQLGEALHHAAPRQSRRRLCPISDRRVLLRSDSRRFARPGAGDARRSTRLQEVVRKYPQSEYAIAAQKKIAMARDQLAGKEMDIGRFYERSATSSAPSTASRSW